MQNFVPSVRGAAAVAGFVMTIQAMSLTVVGVVASVDTVCAVALKIFGTLYTTSWISLSSCQSFTAFVIQHPVAFPLICKGSLVIAGIVTAVVLVKFIHWIDQRFPGRPPIRRTPIGFAAIQSVAQAPVRRRAAGQPFAAEDEWGREVRMPPLAQGQAADQHLKALTDFLVTLPNVSWWALKSADSHAIDAGGPGKEMASRFLSNLALQERPHSQLRFSKTGEYYDLTDGDQPLKAADIQLCENVGTLLGAVSAGFMGRQLYKLGSFFSPLFYASLIYLHEQRKQQKIQDEGVSIFEKLARKICPKSDSNKTKVCLFLASMTLGSFTNLPLDQLSSCHLWTNVQQNQLLQGVENLKAVQIEEGSVQLPSSLTIERLSEPATRKSIKAFIEQQMVNQYGSSYAPLVAVLDGMEKIPEAKERLRIPQREANYIALGVNLAEAIQGPPFTRSEFLKLLPNIASVPVVNRSQLPLVAVAEQMPIPGPRPSSSIFGRLTTWARNVIRDDPQPAPVPVTRSEARIDSRANPGSVLGWTVWWLRTQATDAECLAFYRYVTGSSVLDNNALQITISSNGTFSSHTCSRHLEISSQFSIEEGEDFIAALKGSIEEGQAGFNNI